MPAGDADLETDYSVQDIADVASKNNVRVGQSATDEYAIHQYKDFTGAFASCDLEWEGQTNCAPVFSTVYLQIFNRNTPAWETMDSDNVSAADTDFTLSANVADLTDYADVGGVISCRVWQLAV